MSATIWEYKIIGEHPLDDQLEELGGVGWKPANLQALVPGELSIHHRMHLTQDMARAFLPLLEHFADTGDLP